MHGTILTLLLFAGSTCCAEGVCFRSVAEAAAQSGMHDPAGYRLVDIRRDAFLTGAWAKVVSCTRPERPALVVRSKLSESSGGTRRLPQHVSQPIVVMGARVLLVRREENLRLELAGTALSTGQAGDRVRIRLESPLDGSNGKIVVAIVKADGAVEMEL